MSRDWSEELADLWDRADETGAAAAESVRDWTGSVEDGEETTPPEPEPPESAPAADAPPKRMRSWTGHVTRGGIGIPTPSDLGDAAKSAAPWIIAGVVVGGVAVVLVLRMAR